MLTKSYPAQTIFSWHHLLHKITVLEIDLAIDLTAFLELRTVILLSECCTAICIDFYIF